MGQGHAPEQMHLPLDKQSMVTNLVAWLARAREHFNGNEAQRDGICKCWDKTRIPEATTSSVKEEAISRVNELFAGSSPDDGFIEPGAEPDPTDSGAPVDNPDDLPVTTANGQVIRKAKSENSAPPSIELEAMPMPL